MRIQQLTEAPRRTATIAFGRMNPPTIGHAKLVDAVKSQPGDPYIFLSQSQKPKTDPLSFEQKLGFAKAFFPGVTVGDPEVRTIFDALIKIHGMGYTDLVYVAGSDRVAQFEELINKYNGQEDYYNFDSIQVVSAGERDPDAEGAAGMSASKMRAAAVAGDFEAFKSGTPNPDLAQNMFDAVKQGMGMMESLARIIEVATMLRQLNEVRPLQENVKQALGIVVEAWSKKYKDSINCSNPKGFSQKAHCAGRQKTNEVVPALAVGAAAGAAGATLLNKYGDRISKFGSDVIDRVGKVRDKFSGSVSAALPAREPTDPAINTRMTKTERIEMIRKVAKLNNIPPHIMLAIADQESGFDQKAVGDKDQKTGRAVGMFQVRPPAIQDINDFYGTTFTKKDRIDPSMNAQMAALYYKLQLEKYNAKNAKQALAGYNAGPGGQGGEDYAKSVIKKSKQYESELKEATEIEFMCVNANFCDATDQKSQDALYQALKNVPGIIVYRQDFPESEHNSMAAILKQSATKQTARQIATLAKKHNVGIDLENDVSNRFIDEIYKGTADGLIDFYDTDNLTEAPRDLGAETNTASDLQGQLDDVYNRQAKGRVAQGKTEEQTVGSIDGHTLKKYEFLENGRDTMYLILVDADDSPVFQTKLAEVEDGLAVVSTTSLGKVRATSVYKWVLDNESEVLYSDVKQTAGGQKLWKNLGATYPDLKITDAGERLRAELGEAMSPLEKLRKFDKSRIGGPKIFVDKPASGVNYVKPQFDVEWEEANRYDYLEKLGQAGWQELANKGKVVTVNKDSVKKIGNTGADGSESLDDLEPDKVARLKQAMEKGTVEMPIVVKQPDGSYDLIAGNTRLIGLITTQGSAKVWLVDASELKQNESISEAGVGRVTQQNQTSDVGPNELKVQAKKMGFNVDKDGRPPLLHKTVAKNSDPNTLFNMGLAEGQLNEKGSIGIPLSSGLTVMIHPRRPLKIKKSKKKVKMVGAG